MPSLHLSGVSYAHSSAVPVLVDCSLDLVAEPSRWIGVVGANGAGKSTLLRLMAGQLRPTRGTVDARAAVVVHVAQDVDVPSAEVVALAAAWDGASQRLRRELDLDPDELHARPGGWAVLSPGRRKRWQLAAALVQEPDLLLLDEPTNHLDRSARERLLDTLERRRCLGLVVSHDRRVLDRLTDGTVRILDGRVELHAGSYTEARTRWEQADRTARESHERARREERRLRGALGDVRRERHGAEAGPRRERRLAGATQPDARESGRKLAQRKAEAALARRVRQLDTRVARAGEAVEAIEVRRQRDGVVGFREGASRKGVLASVVGDVPHAGGGTLLRAVDVTLHRGDRVHVRGANGAGKTTLLEALLRQLVGTGSAVGSLSQEPDDAAEQLARVRCADPGVRGRILGVVALLGIDPDRLLVSDDPSPGEARKLALAELLSSDLDVVVLDEPTNHLDLPSIERLEAAMRSYGGTLVLVSHDDLLADATTTSAWEVADGGVRRWRLDP